MPENSPLVTFDHVIGGELPLSPADAGLWSEPTGLDSAVISDALSVLGIESGSALWLRFGRSAIGTALKITNCAGGTVAAPDYLCQAVYEKIRASGARFVPYAVGPSLAPEFIGSGAAPTADLILTCAYFGAAAVDAALTALQEGLARAGGRPWIIEDRVMATPDPAAFKTAAARADFIVLSLRKFYPVPDGAVLVASSDAAREAMNVYRGQAGDHEPAADRHEFEQAISDKVQAKVKRFKWVGSMPAKDDPALNGLVECRRTEALIDASADKVSTDGAAGTEGSARYVAARDVMQDAGDTGERGRALAGSLRQVRPDAVPFEDCAGFGLPLLIRDRPGFLAAAAERGMFLPVHWPRDKSVPAAEAAQRWYNEEVTIPLMPAGQGSRPDDLADWHLADSLAPLVSQYG